MEDFLRRPTAREGEMGEGESTFGVETDTDEADEEDSLSIEMIASTPKRSAPTDVEDVPFTFSTGGRRTRRLLLDEEEDEEDEAAVAVEVPEVLAESLNESSVSPSSSVGHRNCIKKRS